MNHSSVVYWTIVASAVKYAQHTSTSMVRRKITYIDFGVSVSLFADVCFESTPVVPVGKHKKVIQIQSTPISHVGQENQHRHARKVQLDSATDEELRKK